MRYDRARGSLDRHATYIVAAYLRRCRTLNKAIGRRLRLAAKPPGGDAGRHHAGHQQVVTYSDLRTRVNRRSGLRGLAGGLWLRRADGFVLARRICHDRPCCRHHSWMLPAWVSAVCCQWGSAVIASSTERWAARDLVESGDLEDAQDARSADYQCERSAGLTEPFEAADEGSQAGGVEEVHLAQVGDEVHGAFGCEIPYLFAQHRRGVDVDFAGHLQDGAVADRPNDVQVELARAQPLPIVCHCKN